MIALRKTIIRLLVFSMILGLTGCTVTMRVHDQETQSSDAAPYFMLNKLPDIGGYVDDTICNRRYPETRENLIPGEDYGKLIPFIGNIRDFHLVDFQTGAWLNETVAITKYGLMNLQGEIIVDAVYDGFEITMTKDNDYLISLYQIDGNDSFTKRLLCNSDGSWVMEINADLSCCLGAWSNGYVIVTDHSKINYEAGTGGPIVTFYDLEGNAKFHFNNCDVNSYEGFCDGYMIVQFYSDYFEYTSQSVFIDTSGKISFPEIHPCSNFVKGKAPAQAENGLFGLFSVQGNWLIEPIYQDLYLSGNYYIASNGYDFYIFDLSGKLLNTIDGLVIQEQYLSSYGDNLYLEFSYNDFRQGYVTRYTDALTMKEVRCKENGLSVTHHLDDTNYFYCNNGATTFIVDPAGNTVATLDAVGSVYSINQNYVALIQGSWEDDIQPYSVYDLQTSQLLWTEDISNTEDATNLWHHHDFIVRLHSNNSYMYEVSEQDLLDIKTGQPILEGMKAIQFVFVGDTLYLGCADDFYTYFYDADLTLLMKVRNTTTD